MLCSVQNLVLGHGTPVRYSLGTNVNSPFNQVLTLEFGHVRDLQCTRAKKWALSPCVHIVFVSSSAFHFFVFVAISSCFKMVFGRAKWGTYEHRTPHFGYWRCEHNSILYLYPGTGSRVPSVDSSLVHFHGYKHFTFEWYKIWLAALFKVLNVATVVTLILKNAQNYACWNPTDHITEVNLSNCRLNRTYTNKQLAPWKLK